MTLAASVLPTPASPSMNSGFSSLSARKIDVASAAVADVAALAQARLDVVDRSDIRRLGGSHPQRLPLPRPGLSRTRGCRGSAFTWKLPPFWTKAVHAPPVIEQLTVTLAPFAMSGETVALQVPNVLLSASFVAVKVTVEEAEAPLVPAEFCTVADTLHGSPLQRLRLMAVTW